jgi:hypothetical protein
MSAPLIDSARIQLSGLSEESFDDPAEIGETRVFTVLARCTAHNERAMANEGVRRSVTMKVERVLPGVDHTIEDSKPSEPSLFDTAADPEPVKALKSVPDEPREADPLDEFKGPSFSGASE